MLVENQGEEAYFSCGWLPFMDEYRLVTGCTVVFKYDGDNHFFVTIFRPSRSLMRLYSPGSNPKCDFRTHIRHHPVGEFELPNDCEHSDDSDGEDDDRIESPISTFVCAFSILYPQTLHRF